MNFPRFQIQETETIPATSATPATLSGAKAEKAGNVADVASVAAPSPKTAFFASPETCIEVDLVAFHERAAIREHDGGLPRLDAENEAARELGYDTASALYSDVIASWRSKVIAAPKTEIHGFGKLAAVSIKFLASEWPMKALEAGWDDLGLFAVHEGSAPRERLDAQGLVPLITWGVLGCTILGLNRHAAALRTQQGSTLHQPRVRANFDQAVPWWRHSTITHGERS